MKLSTSRVHLDFRLERAEAAVESHLAQVTLSLSQT
jgi:hypothetical protein